jgi:2-oxoisovalerate dehydrogenase E2 component (dihydrolipoyl transacylase)
VGRFVFKLPDLGEGTVEAEVIEWHVEPGDEVMEDQVVVDVMTDKANVEIPAPVTGIVVSLGGEPGDVIPVGMPLITFDTEEDLGELEIPVGAVVGSVSDRERPDRESPPTTTMELLRSSPPAEDASPLRSPVQPPVTPPPPSPAPATDAPRVLTSPAIRRRARETGIDLSQVHGTGPRGRITRDDLESYISSGGQVMPSAPPRIGVEEIKVIGVRRVIAERMSASARSIPHFAYVEEIDVTELEALRQHLNAKALEGQPHLTYLPFLALALVKVLRDFPQCNATYDADRNVILRHHAVHLGVATQSPDGLKVPVVHHAETRLLWDMAAEIRRVSEAARDGSARPQDLGGSTITVTSLGRLGGIASTPVINAPEVAIIGVNKSVERPVVKNGAVAIRRMMNLSSSFDHRFVDGFDAAALIAAIKDYLEHPGSIFV